MPTVIASSTQTISFPDASTSNSLLDNHEWYRGFVVALEGRGTWIRHPIAFPSAHLHLFLPFRPAICPIDGRGIRDTGALNSRAFVTRPPGKNAADLYPCLYLSPFVPSFPGVPAGRSGVTRECVRVRQARPSFPDVLSVSLSVLRKPPAASAQECMKSVTAPRRNLPFESSRTWTPARDSLFPFTLIRLPRSGRKPTSLSTARPSHPRHPLRRFLSPFLLILYLVTSKWSPR